MSRYPSSYYDDEANESWAKALFRKVFIAVHRPGPITVFSMLAFAASAFVIAYALGHWV